VTARRPDAISGRVLDLRLHLLDRQLVGSHGELLGKVDDLELTEGPDGGLYVTALLSGPVALGWRLGGRLGRLVIAAAGRLSRNPAPAPARIDVVRVTDIGSAVTLDASRDDEPSTLERWLDRHLIGRIPGSGHESE
jgi:hypothetical protein